MDDTSDRRLFTVTRLQGDSVVLNGNHPFAGLDLVFEVEIVSAREAVEADYLDSSPPTAGQLIH